MIINDVLARKEYVGDGVVTVFAYDFGVLDAHDIQVLVEGTIQVLDVNYTVSGVGNEAGGNVTFAAAPVGNVILLRSQPIEQTSEYPRNEEFPASRVENDFTKQTMIAQMMREVLQRAFVLDRKSLLDAPAIPDPTTVDTFLSVVSLSPLTFGWTALAALAGAVSIPLSFANGGTGASYAGAAALAKGLSLARWAQIDVTPASGALTLPDPLTGNNIQVQGGNFSAISTVGLAPGTILVLTYAVGGNVLTDSASFQLYARTNYTTTLGDKSVFHLVGTTWYELLRVPNHVAGNAGKFARGDGTWQTLPAQTLRAGVGAGLLVTNNPADGTNDIDVSIGDAVSDDADPTLRVSMFLSSTFTKQLDATWAAGTNAGMRVSGQSLADGVWHIFLFRRSGGAIDICASNSLTFTTPDGGDKRIRIFSAMRTGGTIRRFLYEGGKRVLFKTPTLDHNANVGTTETQAILPVPTGLPVEVLLNVGDAGTAGYVYMRSPNADTMTVSSTAAPLGTFGTGSGAAAFQATVRTDNNGVIILRSSTSKLIRLATIGYDDVTLLR